MISFALSLDETLTMKALQCKERMSGAGMSHLFARSLDRNDAAAEDLGMKNMCFRVDPVTQARFEVALESLSMSKQEGLMVAVHAFLLRFEEKMVEVGIGTVSIDGRLRELGFEFSEPDAFGAQELRRVAKA